MPADSLEPMSLIASCLVWFLVAGSSPPEVGNETLRRFVENWCVDCHEGARAKSDLDLAALLDRLESGETPASLERIITRLERRDMPPEGDPRPDDSAYEEVIGLLDEIVERHATGPPGRATVRRLGRHEYANTVRDLLGVELRIEEELPADEIGDGFDNNGDALSIPPLLLEKYFRLAESVALGVVADPDVVQTFERRYDEGSLSGTGRSFRSGHSWSLPSRGSVVCKHPIPAKGSYRIRAAVRGKQAGPDPVELGFVVDGRLVERFTVESPVTVIEELELELELEAGPRSIGVAFLNDFYNPEDPDPAERDRNAFVEWIPVEGPTVEVYPTELQARLMARYGDPARAERVRPIIRHLADRLWRRPVDSEEIDRLLSLTAVGDPGWFRVRTALTALLVHPRFLFKIESSPNPGRPTVTSTVGRSPPGSRTFSGRRAPTNRFDVRPPRASSTRPRDVPARSRG